MATEADIETFKAFRDYDFDNDDKFQSGMASILKRAEEDPSSQNEVVERAKWFYYTKFINSFDLEAFRAWNGSSNKEEEKKEELEEDTKEDAPRRLTFQELVEMIETGQEIPGIRQIPNKINEGTPSEPKLSARRKPWEATAAQPPSE